LGIPGESGGADVGWRREETKANERKEKTQTDDQGGRFEIGVN